jgi:hypothetical protein
MSADEEKSENNDSRAIIARTRINADKKKPTKAYMGANRRGWGKGNELNLNRDLDALDTDEITRFRVFFDVRGDG